MRGFAGAILVDVARPNNTGNASEWPEIHWMVGRKRVTRLGEVNARYFKLQ
jgi:hypothetical protein